MLRQDVCEFCPFFFSPRLFFMILSSLPNTFQKVRRVSPAQRGGLTARQSAARLQRAAVMASSQSEKRKAGECALAIPVFLRIFLVLMIHIPSEISSDFQ